MNVLSFLPSSFQSKGTQRTAVPVLCFDYRRERGSKTNHLTTSLNKHLRRKRTSYSIVDFKWYIHAVCMKLQKHDMKCGRYTPALS